MESPGETLREVREARGFALEDIEKALRIKVRHLKAMEAGDFGALPSPVQARGFLRNYARYLGLDTGQILARYDELMRKPGGLRGVLRGRTKVLPEATPTAPHPAIARRRPNWISPDLIIGGLITLALLAIFVWGGTRLADAISAGDRATPVVSSFFLPTLTPTLPTAEVRAADGATTTPLPPLAAFTDVQIQVLVEQRSYLRVMADGEEAFAGMVIPGESKDFVGTEVVEIATGNGAGIHVFFNQRDQGVLGRFGEVVIRLWTLDGPITPTPTITPTPARTTVPTRTPQP